VGGVGAWSVAGVAGGKWGGKRQCPPGHRLGAGPSLALGQLRAYVPTGANLGAPTGVPTVALTGLPAGVPTGALTGANAV